MSSRTTARSTEIEVVTGQSDGRHTVVTSRELKLGMKVVTSVKAAEK
jgi:HlyD family secretion protein